VSSALLAGLAAGLSLTTLQLDDPTAHFKVATGLDLLFETGEAATLRLEATHEVDVLAMIGGGYFAAGLRENVGVPLGLSLGAAFARHRDGELALGGRALLSYGLYFARVAIEVDATILEPFGRGAREGVIFSLGVGLRVVPWSPFRL
jgi:hypothetical protein